MTNRQMRREGDGSAVWSVAVLAAVAITIASGLSVDTGADLWPSHQQMLATLDSWQGRWRWVLGDASEVTFYKHEFASVGLLAGAALAHWAQRHGKSWQGFAICYGTGRWPWLAAASLGGMVLANLLMVPYLHDGHWQPTFVASVSLPAAIVLLFGGGWKVTVVAAISGALLVTPLAALLVNSVCAPLGIPAVVGNVLAMAVASTVAFAMAHRIGLHPRPSLRANSGAPHGMARPRYGWWWGVRRVLADFSEAPFLGNELASAGLIAGVLLAAWLQPSGPFYGTGGLLALLCGQALASAVGVWVWRERWIRQGWYPTYIPIVSVVPACILTHGTSAAVVVMSALLGSLFTPPLAAILSARLPAYIHSYVGNLLAMAAGVLLIVPIVGWLLKETS